MQKNVEHLMSVYLSTECFESNHGALSPAFEFCVQIYFKIDAQRCSPNTGAVLNFNLRIFFFLHKSLS